MLSPKNKERGASGFVLARFDQCAFRRFDFPLGDECGQRDLTLAVRQRLFRRSDEFAAKLRIDLGGTELYFSHDDLFDEWLVFVFPHKSVQFFRRHTPNRLLYFSII